MNDGATNAAASSVGEVRRVAALARLELTDERAEAMRGELERVLAHAERLLAQDVEGVEPMAHAGDAGVSGVSGGSGRSGGSAAEGGGISGRSDEDVPAVEPGGVAWVGNAPRVVGPFFGVPRVLGGGET